jgi:hypothetical protein
VDCHDWVDDCFCLVHAPALGKSQVNSAKYFILSSGVVLEWACIYIMKYILFKQLSSMCVCLYSTDVSRYYMACLSTYKGERGAKYGILNKLLNDACGFHSSILPRIGLSLYLLTG